MADVRVRKSINQSHLVGTLGGIVEGVLGGAAKAGKPFGI